MYYRRVLEIIFTCSYDSYRSIYAAGGCWESIDLGLCAAHPATTTSVYGTIPIIEAGKNDLENAPNVCNPL